MKPKNHSSESFRQNKNAMGKQQSSILKSVTKYDQIWRYLKVYKLKNQDIRFYNKYLSSNQNFCTRNMYSQFFSTNSAFQRFVPPVTFFQENQKNQEKNLLQNQIKPVRQIPSDKIKIVSIQSQQIEEELSKQEEEQELSRQYNPKDENESVAKTLDDHISGQLKKKRKTKHQIAKKEKDEGRGGNCIASNITKTLLRIIKIKVQYSVWKQFCTLIERYKVKSQKQNTVILLLILYVFAKQNKIEHCLFENILAENFFKSLEQSKVNCEKKMQEEHPRRSFHLKNRKMYNKFIEINTKLFEHLKVALEGSNCSNLELDQIQEIISDTYDRKQREVQKAINKIKSIILNHAELKSLFGYSQNNVIQTYQHSVEYAYRRNLPKRCKQTLSKVNKFFEEFQQSHNLITDEEKYFVCYLATKIIGEKEQQIWNEFIQNLNMNKQFNTSEKQLQNLTHHLKDIVPKMINTLEELKKKMDLLSNQCKQEFQDSQQQKFYQFYKTYVELSMKIQN